MHLLTISKFLFHKILLFWKKLFLQNVSVNQLYLQYLPKSLSSRFSKLSSRFSKKKGFKNVHYVHSNYKISWNSVKKLGGYGLKDKSWKLSILWQTELIFVHNGRISLFFSFTGWAIKRGNTIIILMSSKLIVWQELWS